MPLQKIQLKSGVNRENTRYTNEGGWYESDKVRFRQGTPEKIGGWARISANYLLGVCRSLWTWATLASQNLLGVGTNLKFYIENDGTYYDITPITAVHTLTNPFTTDGVTARVTVTDGLGGYAVNSFVTFNGTAPALTVGGITLSGEYQITSAGSGSYTVTTPTVAAAGTSTGTVYASYQLPASPAAVVPLFGWGAGTWGSGVWGTSGSAGAATVPLAIWNQNNFGQNLIYGPRGGALYYWDATVGYAPTTATLTIASPCVVTSTLNLLDLTPITFQTTGALPTGLIPGTVYYTRYLTLTTFNLSATPTGALITTTGTQSGVHSISPRGIAISALAGASDTPLNQTYFLISDASRFVICFGTNDYLSTVFDPMLIRWSDQESVTNWTPAVTNQSGSIRLSHGSKIVTALQSRQEILVWTDSTLYSMQYLGPPYVWGTTLLGDNVSIAGPNAAALASGVTYWMGVDKFYKYDGRVQTLNCDLLRFIYNDINRDQFDQVFASTNEGFNEVWWFYCTADSNENNRYVVYNYLENVWYYGSMGRSAWLDTGLRNYPIAATYYGNIVNHELGVDDGTFGDLIPIEASITSAQFDIGDGHNFAFVYRMLPDLTFNGSTPGTSPAVTMYLQPLKNSGSGYTAPASVGGVYNQSTPTAEQTAAFTTAQTLVLQMIIGAIPVDLYYDLNGDGVIGIADAVGFGQLAAGVPLAYAPNPQSIYTAITQMGENAKALITGIAPIEIDEFTGQVFIRVRGRQMSMKITSNQLGTQWQLGSPRIDTRPDGRRGG